VRTLANLVAMFGERYEFRVITRDRDFGDATSYEGIARNSWTKVGKSRVCYASSLSIRNIRRWICEANPNVVYLNSFFSTLTRIVLLLRYLHLLPKNNIILAPRGEFSPGALKLKSLRKRLYLMLCRGLGLMHGIVWQSSSDKERWQIRAAVGSHAEIYVAPDLNGEAVSQFTHHHSQKSPGSVRLVFLARITPIKNLARLLELMKRISGRVELDIYGPVQDSSYWHRCEQIIAHMPPQTTVRYCGSIPNDKAVATISQYHFFVLPTLGENFGHAIFEALSAGRPVLISDQTQWRGLVSKHAGWDLALADEGAWKATLQACIEMDQIRYDQLSTGALNLAKAWLSGTGHLEETRQLFDKALHCQSSSRSDSRC
jgi:glycosyltransferase involved in cell wall biosynthesis